MAYFHLRGIYTLLVCGGVDFFQYPSNLRTLQVQFFFSIQCSHKGGIMYTRFHASMLSPSMVFVRWRKTGVLKVFFNNSCDTLIWVRIISVKVDRSFTSIIRTYINFAVLHYSLLVLSMNTATTFALPAVIGTTVNPKEEIL